MKPTMNILLYIASYDTETSHQFGIKPLQFMFDDLEWDMKDCSRHSEP